MCAESERRQKNWKEAVKDLDEMKVFSALDGPECTWRILGGIARQTGWSGSGLPRSSRNTI
jgi:hypothetical protein